MSKPRDTGWRSSASRLPLCQPCSGGAPFVGGLGVIRTITSMSQKCRLYSLCLRWRMTRKKHQQCRFLHLKDSMVMLHALSRGRSSSRNIQAFLSKANALLLASNVHPIWGYISTKQNPADRPSKRPVRKQLIKMLSILFGRTREERVEQRQKLGS